MDLRSLVLTADFGSRITTTFGDAGRQWLTELSAIATVCAETWHLSLEDPYPEPSYQLVFRATGPNGNRLALKLGVPRDELRHEAAALRVWAGQGTVRLIDDDPGRGALLLERIEPGTQLADVAAIDDDRATEIGAAVMRRVAHAGAVDPDLDHRGSIAFPTLREWGMGFDRYLRAHAQGGPIDLEQVARASAIFASLDASTARRHVLHGDLHHHNVLRSGPNHDDWVVIDPKGVLGDPAFEVGAFLRNPGSAFGPRTDGAVRTRRRIDILTASSGLERERLVDWAWAGTVLSAAWCVEDDGPSSATYTWPLQVAQWIAAAR